MDIATIDQEYGQLQNTSQQVYQELKNLAAKLQTEAGNGNQQAREWMLDLKEIALAIQSQQQQTTNLLQAIHGFVANQNQGYNTGTPALGQANAPNTPQAGFFQGNASRSGQQGGGLGGFLQSGFGRAMEMGLGFGLGDDLINKLF